MKKLYQELENYSKRDVYPFHMPGHKRNPLSVDGEFPLDRDITEINDFDNLHHPEGMIKQAQEEAAKLYGTKQCFFSVNGSTAALLAAISAVVPKGGKILLARNCHKAVYHGLYLRELQPVYIYPHEDSRLGINGGITSSRVERCLEEDSDIKAVLITSPTYDGVVSDVKQIAHTAHKYGIPLIVDEAHGAHFIFSEYFPLAAEELGADVVVQSFHKTLPSMTQTAVLHICSDRVDVDKVKRFMGIYQSSSPSYILMASMDACVDKLERDGYEMFREFTSNLRGIRSRLEKCLRIRLVSPEMLDSTGVYDFDKSKLLFSTAGTSLTGIGGFGAGFAYTMVRYLGTRHIPKSWIIFLFSAFSCLAALPWLLFHYEPMCASQFFALIGAGLAAAGGQFGVTNAYFYAVPKDISVYDYTQIIFAAFLGFFLFDQIPDKYSILGYTIIISMAILMFLYHKWEEK